MEAIGLGGPENAGRRLTVLRAIDKLDRLGPAKACARCSGAGRKDESGDFTKGAGLETPPKRTMSSIPWARLRRPSGPRMRDAAPAKREFAIRTPELA